MINYYCNIVKYNLLTILKLQHDILRPCSCRPIIKVQNPNLRLFSLYHTVSLPLSMHLSLSSLCDKTIIEWFLSIIPLKNILLKFAISNLQYQYQICNIKYQPLGWYCKFSQNIFQCLLRNHSIIVYYLPFTIISIVPPAFFCSTQHAGVN